MIYHLQTIFQNQAVTLTKLYRLFGILMNRCLPFARVQVAPWFRPGAVAPIFGPCV